MANEESQKTAQEKRQTRVGHCKADGTDVYVGRETWRELHEQNPLDASMDEFVQQLLSRPEVSA